MLTERRGLHRICFEAAEGIREQIRDAMKHSKDGRLPKELVPAIRENATSDAQVHRDVDPGIEFGGGPAARPKPYP